MSFSKAIFKSSISHREKIAASITVPKNNIYLLSIEKDILLQSHFPVYIKAGEKIDINIYNKTCFGFFWKDSVMITGNCSIENKFLNEWRRVIDSTWYNKNFSKPNDIDSIIDAFERRKIHFNAFFKNEKPYINENLYNLILHETKYILGYELVSLLSDYSHNTKIKKLLSEYDFNSISEFKKYKYYRNLVYSYYRTDFINKNKEYIKRNLFITKGIIDFDKYLKLQQVESEIYEFCIFQLYLNLKFPLNYPIDNSLLNYFVSRIQDSNYIKHIKESIKN